MVNKFCIPYAAYYWYLLDITIEIIFIHALIANLSSRQNWFFDILERWRDLIKSQLISSINYNQLKNTKLSSKNVNWTLLSYLSVTKYSFYHVKICVFRISSLQENMNRYMILSNDEGHKCRKSFLFKSADYEKL